MSQKPPPLPGSRATLTVTQLDDPAVWARVLAGNDPHAQSEVELTLRRRFKLSESQFELWKYTAQLRHAVQMQQGAALLDRARNNPIATELEYTMGIYAEEIEPQVRKATLALRQKGYKTRSSGFNEIQPSQHISGDGKIISTSVPIILEGLKKLPYFKERHIEIEWHADENGWEICVKADKKLTLDEWKYIWDFIATTMPREGKSLTGEPQEKTVFHLRQETLRRAHDTMK